MTPAELEALGRRAVACKHWRWMDGMLTTDGLRVVEGGILGALSGTHYVIGHRSGPTINGGGWFDGEATGLLPDLTDPATLGCLLALVREAWKNHTMSCFFDHADVAWSEYPWAVKLVGLRVVTGAYGQTEAEALVAALEAAP